MLQVENNQFLTELGEYLVNQLTSVSKSTVTKRQLDEEIPFINQQIINGLYVDDSQKTFEQKEALNDRLVKRGNEQELAIKHRLKRFETEMEFKEKFDYHFVNENLNKAIDKVEKLIKRKIK